MAPCRPSQFALIEPVAKVQTLYQLRNEALPDGTDALKLVPSSEIVCHDGIDTCSFASRDFAFMIDNAAVGIYEITFDSGVDGEAAFDVEVVGS